MSDLRLNIIKQAKLSFVQYGIRSVAVDDICSSLRISKKTFYTEFAKKEDLVAVVHRELIGAPDAMSLNGDEIVVDVFMRWKSNKSSHSDKFKKLEKFMYDLHKYYMPIHQDFVEERRLVTEKQTKDFILLGVKQGYFRSDVDADIFASLTYGWFQLFVNSSIDIPIKKKTVLFEMAVEGYLRMVCNDKGLRYYLDNYTK